MDPHAISARVARATPDNLLEPGLTKLGLELGKHVVEASVVLLGDGVGRDVHLGLVGDVRDLTRRPGDLLAQRGAAGLARAVEAVRGGAAAARAREVELSGHRPRMPRLGGRAGDLPVDNSGNPQR